MVSKPQRTEAKTSKVTHTHVSWGKWPFTSLIVNREPKANSFIMPISDFWSERRGEEVNPMLPKYLHYCSYHPPCSLQHFRRGEISFCASRDKSPKCNSFGQKVYSSSQHFKLCSTEAAVSQPSLTCTRTIAFASRSIQDCTTLVCKNTPLLRYLQHILSDLYLK